MKKIIGLGMLLGISCSQAMDFGGRFQKIVVDELGESRARDQTSFSLAIFDLHTGEALFEEGLSQARNIYPASAIKTLIAIAVLRRVDAGEISLTDTRAVSQPNALFECRSYGCRHYGPGKEHSIDTLLKDMIRVSNNIATNELIDVATKSFCNETADFLSASSLRIHRKVYSYVNPEPEIQERNQASAAGLAEIYREIATGRRHSLNS